jgi:plastocyanin
MPSHVSFVIAALVGAFTTTAYADGKISGSVEAKPSKFLKDSIVYVKEVPNTKSTPKTFHIDQKGMEFVPRIVLIATGDTVKFENHDKVDHSVLSPDGKYDLGVWGSGQEKDHTFASPGVFAQVCKLHPEMLAYVFVGQNRFAALVDDKGAFTIAGLPPGTYEIAIWNPKLKAASQKVTVADAATANLKFSLAR